jgi:hypothetical protein
MRTLNRIVPHETFLWYNVDMKKLKSIPGACAPTALHYASGIDEETVLRVCSFYGFEANQGMDDSEWKNAARDLSLDYRQISIQPCTLKQFIKNHPAGLYLLGTVDHIFCLDNGVIVDPRNPHMPGLNRKIKQAWRVIKD